MPALGELGLKPGLRNGGRSLLVAVGCGLAFGTYMAVADATVFRAAVPEVQRAMLAQVSLSDRLMQFVPGALLDELKFRLVCLTLLAWLIAATTRLRGRSLGWTATLLVAFVIYPVGAWGYFRDLTPSSLTILREVALHGAAGTLWGWLYCRHGWLAGVAGHVSAHLALQPLLGVLA